MKKNVKTMLVIAIGELMVGCIKKIIEEIQAPKQPRYKDSPKKISWYITMNEDFDKKITHFVLVWYN